LFVFRILRHPARERDALIAAADHAAKDAGKDCVRACGETSRLTLVGHA